MVAVEKVNLPWVEKYRPTDLTELVSHEDIIRTIEKFIQDDQVPHLLFYGPPGTGKTTTILACARRLYSSKLFSSMVLELNASDDRGIGIVRGQILTFASTRTIFRSGFKLIILDEADAMTMDAQNALRRIIEKYTENIRFCIICNYLSKIIPALQSRCTRFRFAPLSPAQILPRLNYVIEEEKLVATDDGKQALLTLANGDMRKVLNVLQSTWLAFKNVTEDNVYTCVGHPLKSEIENIIKWLLNENFKDTYNSILFLILNYGDIENLVEDEGSSLLWPPPHGEERQELTVAIYYVRQLLIKHDFIVEISERSALIGRDMFKKFLGMYGNMTFMEEEVLFSNTAEEDSTPGASNEEIRALKKIKIEEDIIYSGSDGEDNVDGRNRIPYAVKIKALELADLHPKWSLATLQKRSTRLLKRKMQLSKWRAQMEQGGMRND
ncbi:hypothetical protein FQA39_LY01347 [Lamprigera yunnana]|nr:hypothetical protein FQA39_LY01347 [Lamprigera yunnana]